MATHLHEVHSHTDNGFLPSHESAIPEVSILFLSSMKRILSRQKNGVRDKINGEAMGNANYLLRKIPNSYYMTLPLTSLWLKLSGVRVGGLRLFILWSMVISK